MLYRQIIYKYVSEHYLDLKDWTITIYSTNKKSNIKENDKLLIFLKPEYISKVENIFQ